MDTIIAHFFVFFAAMSLCVCVFVFACPPKTKLQLSKKAIIIRICLSVLILGAFAAALFFFAKQFVPSLLAAYGLFVAAIIFSVLKALFAKNRNKLQSFWEEKIAPCYPFFIVVLVIIIIFDVITIKSNTKFYNSEIASARESGYNSAIDEHAKDYDNGYSSGKEDGYNAGYSDAESDYSYLADELKDEYSRGYNDGYDDGYEDGVDDTESSDSRQSTSSTYADNSSSSYSSSSNSSSTSASYIANTSTYKFHKPSCSSVKQMKESNKWYYTGSRDDLISQGYDPCGRCHP